MFGTFGFGDKKARGDNWTLQDMHPVERYPDTVHTGNAVLDGFVRLSKADPNYQGAPPAVAHTVGITRQGPDFSFDH